MYYIHAYLNILALYSIILVLADLRFLKLFSIYKNEENDNTIWWFPYLFEKLKKEKPRQLYI